MIPLRYDLAHWAIAVLTLLLIILLAVLRPFGGALVLSVLLVLVSAAAMVSPPGFYGWLFRPICPDCGGRVEYAVEQGRTNPYQEQLVARCSACGMEKVEFSFDPT
jgi:hypothetical protein